MSRSLEALKSLILQSEGQLTISELVERSGYSDSVVYRAVKALGVHLSRQRRRPWSDSDKELAISLRDQGVSIAGIAFRLKRTNSSVRVFFAHFDWGETRVRSEGVKALMREQAEWLCHVRRVKAHRERMQALAKRDG